MTDRITSASQLTAFATLGTLLTTQDVVRTLLSHMPEADTELVAEETLTLLSVLTARAAEAGLRSAPELASSVIPVLQDLPFIYRDYLTAGLVLSTGDAELAGSGEEAFLRLRRKGEFYRMHFPAGQYPSERILEEKLEFWMGRISPPNQPDAPAQRLKRVEVLPLIRTHLHTVLARARQLATEK